MVVVAVVWKLSDIAVRSNGRGQAFLILGRHGEGDPMMTTVADQILDQTLDKVVLHHFVAAVQDERSRCASMLNLRYQRTAKFILAQHCKVTVFPVRSPIVDVVGEHNYIVTMFKLI